MNEQELAYLRGLSEGLLAERERIIKLLEDNLYPLNYGRWQADELLEHIFELIKQKSS